VSTPFLADADALLRRIDDLLSALGTHPPRHRAVHEAADALAQAFTERAAVTGRPVTLHTDGDGWFLDGQRLGYDVFGQRRIQRALAWMTELGANELRAHPPVDPSGTRTFVEELHAALEERSLRPVLADARAGRISVRARPHLRLRTELPAAEGMAADLETIASWVQDALPAAHAGLPPALVVRRALWRVAERVAAEPDAGRAFAVALRPDGEDSLHRHLARTTILAVAFSLALGLDPSTSVEGALSSLEGSLGLATLGPHWWRADGATFARALRARTPARADDPRATDRAVRILELAHLHEASAPDVPFTLESSIFAASAWLDRVRQGLQTELPRCTPTQARAALVPWCRRRKDLPDGLSTALGDRLGSVPPGSVVRCEGLPGVLRSATEVAVVDADGGMHIRSNAAGVAPASSEPPTVAPGYLAARP
jgi:hypothetical protein